MQCWSQNAEKISRFSEISEVDRDHNMPWWLTIWMGLLGKPSAVWFFFSSIRVLQSSKACEPVKSLIRSDSNIGLSSMLMGQPFQLHKVKKMRFLDTTRCDNGSEAAQNCFSVMMSKARPGEAPPIARVWNGYDLAWSQGVSGPLEFENHCVEIITRSDEAIRTTFHHHPPRF